MRFLIETAATTFVIAVITLAVLCGGALGLEALLNGR